MHINLPDYTKQILKRFKMQNQMQHLEDPMFVIMVEPHLATKVILLH